MINVTQFANFNYNITSDAFTELSNVGFGEYLGVVKPLIFYLFGIALYGVFIFKFYRFLARRDIVQLKHEKYVGEFAGGVRKLFDALLNLLQNIILTPLLVFFWFAILALILLFLSKNYAPNTMLLVAASLVGAVRVTSYYNENLSQDLAKMMPFALLGVFLVDISYFSLSETLNVARELPSLWKVVLYYLVFIMSLEVVLRLVKTIIAPFKPAKKD